MGAYVPRKGDFVSVTFDARAGHEQRGHRPAMVVSNDLFNARTGLAFVCPVTSTRRGFPLHVEIPEGQAVTGFVMVEQLKSIDYRARGAKRIAAASAAVLDETLALLDACIY
jgi:mRNA interferase MazF